MPLPIARFGVAAALLALPFASIAQTPSEAPRPNPSAKSGAARSVARPGGAAAKGPLPDPALLDGSALEAEKRPEYGMLGEFDLPGQENSESDKVGGESQPASNEQGSMENAGQSGGAGGANADQQQGKGVSQAPAENDPNAQAEGSQVGELKSDGTSGGAGQSGQKPQQVAMGDSAMQIKPQANVPGVVGTQQLPAGKDVPQQYDKNTPGGKQPTGRGNQGVEKGRVMPSGI